MIVRGAIENSLPLQTRCIGWTSVVEKFKCPADKFFPAIIHRASGIRHPPGRQLLDDGCRDDAGR